MNLYRSDIEMSKPSAQVITVAEGEDFILAVRLTKNGVLQSGFNIEDDEEQCLIESECEFQDYTTFALNLWSEKVYKVVLNGTKVIDLKIVPARSNCVGIDWTENKVPEPEPVVIKPKVVFSDNWCQSADKHQISVQYDNGDFVKVFPGCEATPDNVSYMGFAKYCDLSGSSDGNFKLAMSGLNIEKDTLMLEHRNGYTLFNEVNMDIPIFKNRSTNVNVRKGSYSINVCCFKSTENLFITDGRLSTMVNAGDEMFLSANTSIYNPFE